MARTTKVHINHWKFMSRLDFCFKLVQSRVAAIYQRLKIHKVHIFFSSSSLMHFWYIFDGALVWIFPHFAIANGNYSTIFHMTYCMLLYAFSYYSKQKCLVTFPVAWCVSKKHWTLINSSNFTQINVDQTVDRNTV